MLKMHITEEINEVDNNLLCSVVQCVLFSH